MIGLLHGQNPFWAPLGLSLVHFLWQGAVIAMLLSVVLWLLRRCAPQWRHGACLLSLVLMTACPPATLWYVRAHPPEVLSRLQASRPGDVGEFLRAGSAVEILAQSAGQADAPAGIHEPRGGPAEQSRGLSAPRDADAVIPSRPDLSVPGAGWLAPGLALAAVIWLACVSLLGIRFLVAWAHLQRLRRRTEPLPPPIQAAAVRLLESIGFRRPISIRTSLAVAEPMAFGLLRPMVLLPAALLMRCPVDVAEAVIAHELAHIRRHDLWINLFQRAVETLLFYHPAVWWASGRMRMERELCCDDLAVRATGNRADYAGALVELSRSLHGWSSPILTAGMFSSRLSLPARIRHILQIPGTQHDPNRGRYWVTGPVTLALAGAMLFAAAIQGGAAQSATEGPAARRPASHAAGRYRCDQPVVNLGMVRPGPDIEHTFIIHNDGDSPLQLAEAKPRDPEKTILHVDLESPIQPGFRGRVTVRYETRHTFYGRVFPISSAVELRTNDPRYPNPVLHLVATINPHVLLDPPALDFADVTAGDAVLTRAVMITNNSDRPLEIDPSSLSWSSHFQRPELKTLEEGQKYELAVTLAPARLREGTNMGSVNLLSESLPEPSRRISVLAVAHKPSSSGAPGGSPLVPDAVPSTRPGIGVPSRMHLVRPLIDGLVVEIPVRPGDQVRKGDLLVQLDDAESRLELQAAETRLMLARQHYEHAEQLRERGVVPQEEQLKATADLRLAEVEIKKWQLRVERCQVRSPVDGVIAQLGDGFLRQDWSGRAVKAGEVLLGIHAGPATRPAAGETPAARRQPSGSEHRGG